MIKPQFIHVEASNSAQSHSHSSKGIAQSYRLYWESRSKLSHFLLIAFLFVQHEHCTTGPELLQVYMSISSRNLQKDIYYFTGNSTLKRFELSHRGYVICGC